MRDESQCVIQTGVGEDIRKNSKERSAGWCIQGMRSHGFTFLYYGRGTSPLSLSVLHISLLTPPSLHSSFSLFPSLLYHFCLYVEQFFPADIQSLKLFFFLFLNQSPCVLSVHGSSSPRVG